MTYKRRNTEFESRCAFMADTLKANAQDDARAATIRSIYAISKRAYDFRGVYVDACRRILEFERSNKCR